MWLCTYRLQGSLLQIVLLMFFEMNALFFLTSSQSKAGLDMVTCLCVRDDDDSKKIENGRGDVVVRA